METVPVHKLADIFVASFEISFEEQLSMLDSVDLKTRLSKATELVDRHLQVNNDPRQLRSLAALCQINLFLFVFSKIKKFIFHYWSHGACFVLVAVDSCSREDYTKG